VRFLWLVGTPRSGTTLVHRGAVAYLGDRCGTSPETHVFSRLAYRVALETLKRPGRLTGERRRELFAAHLREVGAGALVENGLPTAANDAPLLGLLESVAIRLAGEHGWFVEKTPNHLRWATALLGVNGESAAIVVHKEPEAAAASLLAAPFGPKTIGAACAHVAHDESLRADLLRRYRGRALALRVDELERLPGVIRELTALERPDQSKPRYEMTSIATPNETWKEASFGPFDRSVVERSLRALGPADVSLLRNWAEVVKSSPGQAGTRLGRAHGDYLATLARLRAAQRVRPLVDRLADATGFAGS
jgi:hypothetical protein